ncbi:MAG: hypothetical protein ACUVV5_01940 [Candidatus Aminicenantales bacterium]
MSSTGIKLFLSIVLVFVSVTILPVKESLHFIGLEKEGAIYRPIVVRKKNEQRALFPEFDYRYRFYGLRVNTAWSAHQLVPFCRKRDEALMSTPLKT